MESEGSALKGSQKLIALLTAGVLGVASTFGLYVYSKIIGFLGVEASASDYIFAIWLVAGWGFFAWTLRYKNGKYVAKGSAVIVVSLLLYLIWMMSTYKTDI